MLSFIRVRVSIVRGFCIIHEKEFRSAIFRVLTCMFVKTEAVLRVIPVSPSTALSRNLNIDTDSARVSGEAPLKQSNEYPPWHAKRRHQPRP